MNYIITERDVGLASLFFQIINALKRCEMHEMTPIVYLKGQCVYYAPEGFNDRSNIWEYYFEPVVDNISEESIPQDIKDKIKNIYSTADVKKLNNSVKERLNDDYVMSCHYGNHRKLHDSLIVPPHLIPEVYDDGHRRKAFNIIDKYFKLRSVVLGKINSFFKDNMVDNNVLGVHVRGTDALVNRAEKWRKAFDIQNYIKCIEVFLSKNPDGKILLASDDLKLFNIIKDTFSGSIINYNAIRQDEQDKGISGDNTQGTAMMPTYLCSDGYTAAQNGEDAIVEMYLLSKCSYLLHNASGFAHFALLLNPSLPHVDSQRPGGKDTMDIFKQLIYN